MTVRKVITTQEAAALSHNALIKRFEKMARGTKALSPDEDLAELHFLRAELLARLENIIPEPDKESESELLLMVAEDLPESHPGPSEYSVRPSETNVENEFLGHFGKREVEETVLNLVLFFMGPCKDSWDTFTYKELVRFARGRNFPEQRVLFGLCGSWVDDDEGLGTLRPDPGFVIQLADGRYAVTSRFIERCEKRES